MITSMHWCFFDEKTMLFATIFALAQLHSPQEALSVEGRQLG